MLNQLQTVPKVILATRLTALVTFALGTVLMLSFYYNPVGGVIYLSLFYIISMLFLNSYFAVRLLQLFIVESNARPLILKTWGILLLNIPVGYFYIQWGLEIYQNATPVN
ncbi:hypothetical protein [Flavobacterium stagni]|uniref:Uncharacterized protein n=1 Tax=Flavobacterium stagni TaxID=2506421 RepID=A0A4Q1KBQ5_9FLAO|nr:hypothetical protein [Flavobacterium stagni]RXR24335.1 hypothetical protein EQG61_02515 [Flavobacterium stagni]